ncbi:dynactin subunit 6-like [Pollicipes pollicipes]|uniref:dynactin subunit 6-like n=1 Tax=Pollicipes pollicipes TaxID=41117 RepID=UPI001884F1F9|nr:dynactin subunit 6-like [Pollicipes pollicipes]
MPWKRAAMSRLVENNPELRIAADAVVCSECELVGDVTIGPRTVVHTRARIAAEGGPIVIGQANLIEEQAEIVNRLPPGGAYSADRVMRIGNNNIFEVDCRSESPAVGDNNVFECKSRVGPETSVSHGCVVGARCCLENRETLPENTVVFGEQNRRRVQAERPPPQTLQLDFLKKVLPNYHYLAVTGKK